MAFVAVTTSDFIANYPKVQRAAEEARHEKEEFERSMADRRFKLTHLLWGEREEIDGKIYYMTAYFEKQGRMYWTRHPGYY